ncbi:MAG TPA: hypothetical protein VE200_04805 [Xanthobacteraceae bacterium]|nr:hypothetical protein [Xanthobacteraceae bacterium]
MSVELEEFEPGRFRVRKDRCPSCRSELPLPFVISDTMPATEQVDGRFYESKAAFRAVGRSLGLTEVGNEKMKPKTRATATTAVREKRRDAIKTAIERYKAGDKPRKA